MTSWRPVFASVFLVVPAAAGAAEGPSALTVEAEIGAVSDYRFRGVSLSGGKPVLQAGVTVSLADGAYASVWSSTIEEYGAGEDDHGATAELDLVVGWSGSLDGLDVDASVQLYRYPGGSGVDYVAFPAFVSRAAGAWRWTLGGAYAPRQAALDHDNTYGWVGGAREGSAPKVDVRVGYERGAYAPDGKWEGSAGVSHAFGGVSAGLAYVSGDRAADSSAVLASLSATF